MNNMKLKYAYASKTNVSKTNEKLCDIFRLIQGDGFSGIWKMS